MKTTVKTRGFEDLERALAEELPKATAKNVLRRAGTNAMKRRIEARAKELAPRDDGELAGSITTRPVKAKRTSRTRFESQSGVAIATGPAPIGKVNRANAAWQEDGTVKMAANPYMRPAFDSEHLAVIDDVRDELALQIQRTRARIARKAAKGK